MIVDVAEHWIGFNERRHAVCGGQSENPRISCC
jgi:hypothetical protein